ncbi:MAG: flagellar hook-associated protein FlgK [Balneolaceae bacterium]|nr:flagellar hook-associated protein FlgK [Balneolaceae bacterium]
MRALFEISKSGLRSAERSLSVTSNNIVNADTPGYTRQRVDKTPVGMQIEGTNIGLGVNVSSVKRLRDEMNDVLINEKRQDMSFMKNKAKVFEQLEASMASDSGSDIDLSISNLLDTFSELSTDPQDVSVRNSLVSEASQLTAKFGDISQKIDQNSELTRESASRTIDSVNELLIDIDGLNRSISQAEAAGNPDNSSLDLRVRKLEELSEFINFETQPTDSGAFEIRVGGIKVLGEDGVSAIKGEINDVDKIFRLRLENGKTIEAEGGRLGAEIEMYESAIPDIKNRLDTLAATIVEEFNGLHVQGYGLEDSTNRNFFDSSFTTAAEIKINQEIIDNPRHIAASDVDGEAGNGEMASRIASLRNERVIENRKLIDYSIDLISSPGNSLSSLNSQIEATDSEIQMLQAQQEREAGVNIDEELSLMIQYQNAYQGAAKVMGAAQQMYDTLLRVLR